MLVVGLTGGVGAGKSTVAALLVGHGAVLIDADAVAREVVMPKSVGLSQISDRFGAQYLTPQGELDRSALADLVFSDAKALADLNAIVHPLVRASVEKRLAALSRDPVTADAIVIVMVPLLIESGHYRCDVVIVIDVDEDVAVRRLVETRGWSESQARARIAAQMKRSERRAVADVIIDNNGSPDRLDHVVDAVWSRLLEMTQPSLPGDNDTH